jgi:hypothetical protein
MRQVHSINLRLRTYFQREIKNEPQELFINPDEDNDITTQDTSKGEIAPTLQDIAEIEAQIQAGGFEV